MEKLIKIWVIVAITTVSAILLPTIAFAVSDEDYDINYVYKGITFRRPHPTAQVSFKNDDGSITSNRYDVTFSGSDHDGIVTTWVMSRVYNTYHKVTRLVLVPILYDVTNQQFCNFGYKRIIATRQGNVPLNEFLVSSVNVSLFKDEGDVATTTSDYIGDFVYKWFNDDNYNVATNTSGLIYNPDTNEWLSDDIKYDLEIVEGVSINISANVKDEYIIKWKPSADLQNKEYYRNVKLEIYQVLNGRAKDKIWDSWQEFYFEPYLYKTPYAYKEIWQGNLEGTEESEQLVGQFLNDDSGFICEYYSSDFVLRYRYLDDNNILHYSKDFVYIQCTSDGTYTISIPDTDDVDDIVPDIPTKENDIYTDEIRTEDDEDIEVTNIFNTIKSLFNTMKDFPDYFGKIFTMFPEWVTTLIAFGIGAIIIIGLLKAIL